MKSLVIIALLIVSTLGKLNAQNLDCEIKDNRVRIIEENKPNLFTCYMEMTRGTTPRYGTGILIHPRVILSAGHNFAWYPNGSVNKVKLYFGSIDSTNYAVSDSIILDGTNRFFKSGYWINGKIHRDFSIIILKDSTVFKKVKGTYKLLNPSRISEISSLNITGSPGDKDLFEMWTSTTGNFSFEDDKIKYDLFTAERNSGSPIWTKIEDNFYVVGVHSRSWGECAAAIFLNAEVQKKIRSWCRKAGINLD